MQILNTGDHWVCVTNVFSRSSHKVYVYNSVYHSVSQSLILQVSSLLRGEDWPDIIDFVVRPFQHQRRGTRLCGYYTVAACVSCVLKHDPAGHLFDEEFLLLRYDDLVGRLFESCELTPVDEGQTYHVSKLHCVSHTGRRLTHDS